MDPKRAIQYGQLVQAAYALAARDPQAPPPASGTLLNSQYDPFAVGYFIEHVLYGNDLATDMTVSPAKDVPFGLILGNRTNDLVISIRGTEGIWEWLQDFAFLQEPCPFLKSGGNTEDGFSDIYRSMYVDKVGTSIIQSLENWPTVINTVTIAGHSLGAALATLLALDLSANSKLASKVSVYTFASPRVGDDTFVNTYDHVVPFTFRIANRMDLVPKLPLPPLYGHVAELFELNPSVNGQPVIDYNISCEHSLNSYLYLLSLLPNSFPQPLDQACTPARQMTFARLGGGTATL